MASSFDKLPVELLCDILQRLRAKDVCRCRTICRSWRSLTSDAAFIKEHAERHKETLFVAKFQDDETTVYVVDLAGDVVKRITGAVPGVRGVDGGDRGLQVLRTRMDVACLATVWNSCRLLDPATGRIWFPALSPEVCDVSGVFLRKPCTFFTLGRVASRGEYKLLRCWRRSIRYQVQVLTINGGTGWRPRPSPGSSIDFHSGIVVDGVVYFFTLFYGPNDPPDNILSFDLANEEWRRDLRGPIGTSNVTSVGLLRSQLSLADLKGSLVLAHHRHHLSTLDLWFLLDFENGLWGKEYSIRTESVTSSLANMHQIIPLLALNDGRLVVYLAAPVGLLFLCDPGTNTFTRVHMRGRLHSVGVYTGNLLRLQA